MDWANGWPDHPVVQGNAARATDIALVAWAEFIAVDADELSPRDAVLADDLAQAGRIALWLLDASKYGPHDEAYLKSSLHLAMHTELRSQHRWARSSTNSEFEYFDDAELPFLEAPSLEYLRSAAGPWPLAFWITFVGEGEHHVWL